jgi:hypothetical protein
VGVLTLAETWRNIIIQGLLYSDITQTFVRSRNHFNLDDKTETAFEKESGTVSKNEK